jgi:hypothetical protein
VSNTRTSGDLYEYTGESRLSGVFGISLVRLSVKFITMKSLLPGTEYEEYSTKFDIFSRNVYWEQEKLLDINT